jgi:hypothetical protein
MISTPACTRRVASFLYLFSLSLSAWVRLDNRPRTLRRIWLVFEDIEHTRTQEFVLRWSQGMEHSFREIVRQEWNFSPNGSGREIEDYAVELLGVTALELIIVPNKSGGEARATLRSFRLG